MLQDLEFLTCPGAQKSEHEKELLTFLGPSDLFMSSKTIIGVKQNKKGLSYVIVHLYREGVVLGNI